MNILIDLTPIQDFLSLSPDLMFWRFFMYFGWMILAVIFLQGSLQVLLMKKREKWMSTVTYTLLAIDIPRGNEQTPKAVENIFTYLSGAHGSINFFEKWFEGKVQLSFSLEIASIEGYTQFIIRTPERFRNLVESAVYSQYPDAEISEIDDYINDVPHKYPDDEYDVWGAEYIHANNHMFPIKVYSKFEHLLGPSETQFKDPSAALMDLCSSLGPGEQLWYQIIVVPIGFDWMDEGDEMVDQILQKKKPGKKGLFMKFIEWLGELSEIFYSIWGDIDSKEEENKETSLSMMELTPKQKHQVEGVHDKISKLAFEVKVRAVYVAKKEDMNKGKVANGFVGYMKQFASLDLNNLKPDVKYTMTKAEYFRKNKRITRKKNNIINNYINRDAGAGRTPGILNIEELATLWHFPVEASVQSPLLQKAPGRKAEAPSSLPQEIEAGIEANEPDFLSEVQENGNKKYDLDEVLEKKEIPDSQDRKIKPEYNEDNENNEESFAKERLDDTDYKNEKEILEEGMYSKEGYKYKSDNKKNSVNSKSSPPENLPFA
ncbi:hypothetical protein K9M50_02580 [Patescibacteria group bacterium]|nr:hypothetical protein [Patescibacteria group bacterium]